MDQVAGLVAGVFPGPAYACLRRTVFGDRLGLVQFLGRVATASRWTLKYEDDGNSRP